MDGYLYLDEQARRRFRLFSLPLESYRCSTYVLSCYMCFGFVVFPDHFHKKVPGTQQYCYPLIPHSFSAECHSLGFLSSCAVGFMSVTLDLVSFSNNFVHSQTAKTTAVTYFPSLLQKILRGSSLPLVEHWDEYVVANLSKVPAIRQEELLSGTGVMIAL